MDASDLEPLEDAVSEMIAAFRGDDMEDGGGDEALTALSKVVDMSVSLLRIPGRDAFDVRRFDDLIASLVEAEESDEPGILVGYRMGDCPLMSPEPFDMDDFAHSLSDVVDGADFDGRYRTSSLIDFESMVPCRILGDRLADDGVGLGWYQIADRLHLLLEGNVNEGIRRYVYGFAYGDDEGASFSDIGSVTFDAESLDEAMEMAERRLLEVSESIG